jgi:cell division protein FtsI/penicillin-binding protein 2
MGWLIFWAVIILLIIYWISKSWIAILIIGLIFSIWLIAQYAKRQSKKRERDRRDRIAEKEHRDRELITSEIDKYLHNALQIMDTTAKWYNNEDEANRELVSVLKAQHIDAVYLHRLSNGRTADARVGNVLIEGKLSPDTSEIDRLIGQISDYTQYSGENKVNIVIYGKLTQDAKNRIEREIQLRYIGQVFLSYLDNPQRLRKE